MQTNGFNSLAVLLAMYNRWFLKHLAPNITNIHFKVTFEKLSDIYITLLSRLAADRIYSAFKRNASADAWMSFKLGHYIPYALYIIFLMILMWSKRKFIKIYWLNLNFYQSVFGSLIQFVVLIRHINNSSLINVQKKEEKLCEFRMHTLQCIQ